MAPALALLALVALGAAFAARLAARTAGGGAAATRAATGKARLAQLEPT